MAVAAPTVATAVAEIGVLLGCAAMFVPIGWGVVCTLDGDWPDAVGDIRFGNQLHEDLRVFYEPMTIECYDISNLGGSLIVGSRVVFFRGLPHKRSYRQYKVRSTKGQDDFASMYEVLSRRMKKGKEDNDLPDLVVIDGGKGQLNVARAVANGPPKRPFSARCKYSFPQELL